MKRHYKKIIIGLFIGFILVGSFPAISHALQDFSINPFENVSNSINTTKSFITTQVTEAFMKPFVALAYLMRMLLIFLLTLVGYIFGFVTDLNFNILDASSYTYKFISTGWTITRDIANLGFVLVIILIALATIVRFQDYEAKKLLPRLIGAAILVNFSLAIPTVFINFSHVLSNYFLSNIGSPTEGIGGGHRLAIEVGSILEPQKTLLTSLSEEDAAFLSGSADVNDALLTGASQLFSLIGNNLFLVIGIFAIGALAVLFLVRFVALHFLLVLAPLAWLTWTIPKTGTIFTKWWSNFLKYTFFLPFSIFFIYLVVLIGNGLYSVTAGTDVSSYIASDGVSQMFENLLRFGAVNLVISGFLIASLLVAQQLSIKGSAGAISLGKSWANGTKKWAQRKTGQAGKAAVASPFGEGIARKLQTSKVLAKIPGISGLSRYAGEKMQAKSYKWGEETKKKKEDFVKDATRGGNLELAAAGEKATKHDTAKEAAYQKMIAEKGKEINEDLIKTKEEESGAIGKFGDNMNRAKNARSLYMSKGENVNGIINKQKEIENNKKELLQAQEDLKNNPSDTTKITDRNRLKNNEEKLNKELLDLISKNQKPWKEYQDARRTYFGARDNVKDSRNKVRDARVKREKTEEASNDLSKRIITELKSSTRVQMEDSKFDLSKTTLAAGRSVRDKQITELHTKKIQKDVDRLAKVMETAEKNLEKVKFDNLSTNKQKTEADTRYNQAKGNYEQTNAQFRKFMEVEEKLRRTKDAIKGTTKDSPDFKKLLTEFKKAQRDYSKIVKGNVKTSPTWEVYKKKERDEK